MYFEIRHNQDLQLHMLAISVIRPIIIPITFIVIGLLPYITFLPFYLIVLIQI